MKGEKLKLILLSFSFCSIVSAQTSTLQIQGGNEVGNGGDVLVCQDSIMLLDFYEAKIKDKKEISASLEKYEDIITKVINNISKADPKRGQLFQKKSQLFFKEVSFLSDVKLTDIPDSSHIVLPHDKRCKLEQIAILDKNQKDSNKKFIINKNLWDKLDQSNQAGLIMHEIIYEYFALLGESNSIRARKYNAFVFGDYSSDQYWKFVKVLRLPIYR